MLCRKCRDRNLWAGQMLTNWRCKKCGKEAINSDTAVPQYCESCAEELNVCEQCGETLDGQS